VVIRTWADPIWATSGSTYVGAEAGLTFMFVRVAAGVSHRVAGLDGPHGTVFTCGVQFVYWTQPSGFRTKKPSDTSRPHGAGGRWSFWPDNRPTGPQATLGVHGEITLTKEAELVRVFATEEMARFLFAKSLLERDHIEYFTSGETLRNIGGWSPSGMLNTALGPAELWVRSEDGVRVRALLKRLTDD
jgi:hypothetical protein